MTDAPAIPVAKPRVRWPLSLIVGAVLTAVVVLTATGRVREVKLNARTGALIEIEDEDD